MIDTFLQTLMNAIAVGSLYALIALGYTMVYGILKFINFAHSDIFALGAWISFSAALCAGFVDADPTRDGMQGYPIASWVLYLTAALAVAAVVLTVYERLVLPRVGAAKLPRTKASGTFLLVAGWAWAILALIHATRAVKGSASLEPVVGVLILLIAMGTCGLVGFCLERLAYKPLRKAPRLNVLITAIGISLLLQNAGALNWMFGTSPQSMPTLIKDQVLNRTVVASGPLSLSEDRTAVLAPGALTLEPNRVYTVEVDAPGQPTGTLVAEAGAYAPGQALKLLLPLQDVKGAEFRVIRAPRVPIRLVDVLGAGTAVLLMVILDWLVFRTKTGRAMRAVSFNTRNAALMGIDVDRVISTTFVIGAALAAAAGFLYGQKYVGINQTANTGWVLLGLKAFVAAVVGGIGNIRGAMLGGILIGFLEMFVAAYISPALRDLLVFVLLIAVLLVKPTGILGVPFREKV